MDMNVIISNTSNCFNAKDNSFPLFRAQCHWCQRTFRSLWELRKHAHSRHNVAAAVRLVMARDCRHTCQLCGQEVTRLFYALQRHLANRHRQERLTPYGYLRKFYQSDSQSSVGNINEEVFFDQSSSNGAGDFEEILLDADDNIDFDEEEEKAFLSDDVESSGHRCPTCSEFGIFFPSEEAAAAHIRKQHRGNDAL